MNVITYGNYKFCLLVRLLLNIKYDIYFKFILFLNIEKYLFKQEYLSKSV